MVVQESTRLDMDRRRLLTVQPLFCLWLGQISASLAAMNRTVEDYDSMAKREMIKAKQEKAMMSVFTRPLML